MPQRIETRCCISGGGPAGMMLGLLLARCGIDVVVLEKHGDFLRDFRGDTVHPSTLEIMHELGLLQAFLQRPHDKTYQLSVAIAGQQWLVADFSHLRQRCARHQRQGRPLNRPRKQDRVCSSCTLHPTKSDFHAQQN